MKAINLSLYKFLNFYTANIINRFFLFFKFISIINAQIHINIERKQIKAISILNIFLHLSLSRFESNQINQLLRF